MSKKSFAFDPANPSRQAVLGCFGEMSATMESWLDKVPEESKQFILALKADVDAALSKLSSQPTDQVPAAQEASWALRGLAEAFAYMGELNRRFMEEIKAINERFGLKVARVNEFEQKLGAHDLLTKEEAQTAIKTAVDEALKNERSQVKLLGTRRSVLCEANLPVPADDGVLAGDDAAFTALKTEADARRKKLAELGVVDRLNAADLADLCFGSKKDYERYLKLVEKARPEGEPLAGGGRMDPAGSSAKLTF